MTCFENRDGGAVLSVDNPRSFADKSIKAIGKGGERFKFRPIDSHRSSMLDDWAAVMAGERLPHTPAGDAKHGLEALVARLVTEELDRRAAEADAAKRLQQPTMRHCLEAASAEFGISIPEILSAIKTRRIVRARQAAIWLARKVTAQSLPEVGDFFGRNQATVHAALERVELVRTTDFDFRERTDRLLSLFIGDA